MHITDPLGAMTGTAKHAASRWRMLESWGQQGRSPDFMATPVRPSTFLEARHP